MILCIFRISMYLEPNVHTVGNTLNVLEDHMQAIATFLGPVYGEIRWPVKDILFSLVGSNTMRLLSSNTNKPVALKLL
jgi:hypothetical protein